MILDQICADVIDKIQNLHYLNNGFRTNDWEEFCFCYQGESMDLLLWEGYIKTQIIIILDTFSESDRLTAWLTTDQGKELIYKRFDLSIPVNGLTIAELIKNIGYCLDDVIEAVYNLITAKATDYDIPD